MMAASWADPDSWPSGDQSNVFLANVLDEVGRSLHGSDWTGNEPTDNRAGPPSGADGARRTYTELPTPPPAALFRIRDFDAEAHARSLSEYEEQGPRRAAHEVDEDRRIAEIEGRVQSWARLDRTMRWIAKQGAEAGRMQTRGRLVAGGEDYFDLAVSVWNIENLWGQRFSRCWFLHADEPTYLFITRVSLDSLLRTLDPPGGGGPSTEKAIESWLIEEFAKPDTKHKSKCDFKSEALARWTGSSAAKFDRAWASVRKTYPSRGKAGRKAGGK